jgi:drug/metabolite transporter (DMT)-like permease
MTGVLWAAAAGVGFGLFQAVNRAAILGMDVYLSTFVQLLVSAAILAAVSLFTGNLSQLWTMPADALLNFSLAGLVHFLVGWTLLNASQKRLGAARTSPLIATTPLFGTVVAGLTLSEVPSAATIAGVATIVGGVYVVGVGRSRRPAIVAGCRDGSAGVPRGSHDPARSITWRASLFGLGAALCWAISPIFTRRGLEVLDSALAGVTVGLTAAVVAYGLAFLARGRRVDVPSASRASIAWKLGAGVLVGASTWARWYSLSLTPVAVVLGLAMLSVPTVIVVAPLLVGRDVERVTPPVVVGSALVIVGALVLILER